MKKVDSLEVKRRWSLWIIVALGLIVFALPESVPIETKSAVAVVLYLLFLGVYMWFKRKQRKSQ